ncbi:alginate lyase family protein [Catalinimonas niigatensis]|uniref:alginate lyase family protein n=1 Tax=Catalinimonas niigatensis TaxID=1397264 RepID=UPI002666F3AC|nr:alginate lyase family protein [Catalinimonas niigatensis]WPP48106.1 alginate lyase family protein [Catalinimonas niigatensis]
MRLFYLSFLLLIIHHLAVAEVSIRQTLLLTAEEQQYLMKLIQQNKEVQNLWYSVKEAAQHILDDQPNPLQIIHYEGLLDTNPKRIATEKSLRDMDKLAVLLNAYYGTQNKAYAAKAKKYILAWVNTYQATGNPINENKFEPLIHSYQVMRSYFSPSEKELVNQWLVKIAEAEMANPNIPENNWKAKQIKLIGTIGLVLQKESYVQYAAENFKAYVDKSLYGDGGSRDLEQRDALSYHTSGLDPLLTYAITVDQLGDGVATDFFRYENPDGGSIKRSVDFVIPYASGEKEYKEWVNTKVELDKRRAEAGLEKYQPGKLFDPKESRDTFELAYFFDPSYKPIIQGLSENSFEDYNSWFSVLIDVSRQNI